MAAFPAGALRQRLLSKMQRACKQQAPLLSSDDASSAASAAVLQRLAEGACQPAVHACASCCLWQGALHPCLRAGAPCSGAILHSWRALRAVSVSKLQQVRYSLAIVNEDNCHCEFTKGARQ